MNNYNMYGQWEEFFKSFMPKHEPREDKQNNDEFLYIFGLDTNYETVELKETVDEQNEVVMVEIRTVNKTTNELLDDYIDLMTLYDLFGDEEYKSKSEYVLGLLKDQRKGE